MQTKPSLYALAREEGQALWFLSCLTHVKATGEQTGGAFGLIEQMLPAGFASPYHVHHAEDETFYILEGEATFISGDRNIKATAGAGGCPVPGAQCPAGRDGEPVPVSFPSGRALGTGHWAPSRRAPSRPEPGA